MKTPKLFSGTLTRLSKTDQSGALRQEFYSDVYSFAPKVGKSFTIVCGDFEPPRMITTSVVMEISEQVYNSENFLEPLTFKTLTGSVYQFTKAK